LVVGRYFKAAAFAPRLFSSVEARAFACSEVIQIGGRQIETALSSYLPLTEGGAGTFSLFYSLQPLFTVR
jgi:hypothetical protein